MSDQKARLLVEHNFLVNRRPSGPDERLRRIVVTSDGTAVVRLHGQPDVVESACVPVPLKNAFKRELADKLNDRRKIFEEQQKKHLSLQRTQSAPCDITAVPKKPHQFDGRPPSLPTRGVMDELKQRLSKTTVTSNFDVDRIVKENKTTTVTESRETIHFRPSQGSLNSNCATRTCDSPPPLLKRLSITGPTRDSEQGSADEVPHIYVNIAESQPKNDSKFGGTVSEKEKLEVDKLMKDYNQLETDLKEMNNKNKELKEKFFLSDKKETPILNNTGFKSSSMVDQWQATSSRTMYRTKPSVAQLTGGQEPSKPGAGKEEKCPFNIIK